MPSILIGGESVPYRLPRPIAARWLAIMSAPGALTTAEIPQRSAAGVSLLAHMIGPDETVEIGLDAMAGILDMQAVADIIYQVLERGSARRYWQDAFLSRVAVARWPEIRGALVARGIPDPLRQLPTLFALLDAVEAIYLEHADQEARDEWDRHYLPPPDEAMRILRMSSGSA